MMNIPGLTNSGSMPINAGAGPSSVGGNEEINFRGGSVSFDSSSLPAWAMAAVAVGLLWFVLRGK
ncbi:hypothetical protein [Photobacterium rosenbergii]|uniref:GlyGly-CTERM sorting domain-containing protein n=1 Tax=Photobacterium rosenbergii TaxID=294936 RepID=A0ABU3ZFE3_9GAMM|nr:hypothetical protein [Photobacterium rosenbergii]MDV5168824.1 hypothetical protein [Photobacterium rosenbergii]